VRTEKIAENRPEGSNFETSDYCSTEILAELSGGWSQHLQQGFAGS